MSFDDRYNVSQVSLARDPADLERHQRNYEHMMRRAERRNHIYPGLYLEYGYIMARRGKTREAIKYYRLEKKHWPESAQLVDWLISSADSRNSAAEPGP